MARLLVPGRNCWRIARAHRLRLLIDGEAYFTAVREALKRARQSVMIVGWEIDSRMRLVPDTPADGLPAILGEFIQAVAERNPELQVRMLIWDHSMLFALERERMPLNGFGKGALPRIQLRLDDRYPLGGSHHQKVVVIDDAVAFVGGLDLSKCRWDTPAHLPYDPRRVDPDGDPYPPFHDVQAMVDGEIAALLGDLLRERWHRATGEQLDRPERHSGDRWPESIAPELSDLDLAIVRSLPAIDGQPGVREVEQLYVDTIRAARHYLYFENQYVSSRSVIQALVRRLREPQGPEIVMVLPKETPGWLEHNTMDVLRARMLRALRAADKHGRLRVFFPRVSGPAGEQTVKVHAKVSVVDDTLLRVGSSNLTNRSMNLDTECDLALEARGDERIRQAIRTTRNRLLGEHLGVEPEDVQQALEATGSLIAAIESLRGRPHTLDELDGAVSERVERELPGDDLVDPRQPLTAERLADGLLPREHREPVRYRGLKFALAIAVLLAMAAVWRWTPLADWVDPDAVQTALAAARNSPLGVPALLGAYVVGGLVAFPLTVLIAATVILFGPVLGFVYGMLGALLSAAVTFGVGSYLGSDFVRRVAGRRINRLSRRLSKRGILMIVTVRVVPVAPYTVINLMAGASHIRFRDYMIGTVIGIAPGLAAIATFVDRLEAAVRDPGPGTFAGAVLVGAAVIGVLLLFRRWLSSNDNGGHPRSS